MMKSMSGPLECTARPGILKYMRNGEMRSTAYKDAAHTKPYVCQCECEAKQLYLETIAMFVRNGLISALKGVPVEQFVKDESAYQDPESFYYVYVDEEPAELDASADAFSAEAESIIEQVKAP